MNDIIRNLLKDVEIPRFVKVKQTFDKAHIPPEKLKKEFLKFSPGRKLLIVFVRVCGFA